MANLVATRAANVAASLAVWFAAECGRPNSAGIMGLWAAISYLAPPADVGAVTTHQLQHGGREREYLMYVPRRQSPLRAIVMVLHGSRMTAAQMRMVTGYRFDQLAEQYGFVVVYPQGFENHWNDCRAGATYSAKALAVDDVGFMAALLATVKDGLKGDVAKDAKAFMAGYSLGGQLAYRVAMQRPELIDGIAPVAANFPRPENNDCEDVGQPMPAYITAGRDDPINPFTGGQVTLFGIGARGAVFSFADTVAQWQQRGNQPVLGRAFAGGHTIPGDYAFPPFLGDTDASFRWPDEVWQFFRTLQ